MVLEGADKGSEPENSMKKKDEEVGISQSLCPPALVLCIGDPLN